MLNQEQVANMQRVLAKANAGETDVLEYVKAMVGIEELPTEPTPYKVIYKKDQTRLLKYATPHRRYRTPILFVYSMINRYTILDFLPGRSLIGYLVEQGFPVYCLDWGVPDVEEEDLTWDDYLGRYIRRSVRKVLRDSGASDLTMYGYCMGGIMGLAYSALYPEGIRNFVAQATPVDFDKAGILSTWTKAQYFDVDAMIDCFGNVPVPVLQSGFYALDPVGMAQKWEGFFKRIEDRKFVQLFLAMEEWHDSAIPFPGELYRKYIKDCYQTNRYMRGEMVIGGDAMRLSDIKAPLLILTGARDSIAPREACAPLAGLVGSDDVSSLTFDCGHIGIATSSRGPSTFWPKVAAWIGDRSETLAAEH